MRKTLIIMREAIGFVLFTGIPVALVVVLGA